MRGEITESEPADRVMRSVRVNRKRRIVLVTLASILLLPTLSCTGDELCYRFRLIERGEWNRDSTLFFNMDSLLLPVGQPLEVSLEITTNNSYRYRDLWLLVEHNLTDTLFRSDTLRLLLADESGRSLGSSAGGLRQFSQPWQQFVPSDSIRSYEIRLHHLMADEPLTGIEKAGVKIIVVSTHQ
jgi:gliding motility-associated lipoprotein GldH